MAAETICGHVAFWLDQDEFWLLQPKFIKQIPIRVLVQLHEFCRTHVALVQFRNAQHLARVNLVRMAEHGFVGFKDHLYFAPLPLP